MRRYDHSDGGMDLEPDGEYVRYEDAAARIAELEAAHRDLVKRNAMLRERPDLPADRIPAYRELLRLQEENRHLRAALDAAK